MRKWVRPFQREFKTDDELQSIAYLIDEGYTVREILDMTQSELAFTMAAYEWIEDQKEKERKKTKSKGRRA